MKFCFDLPTVSERKMFENNGHVYGFITPGERQIIP